MKSTLLINTLWITLGIFTSANAADKQQPDEVVVTAAPSDYLLQPTQVMTGGELLLKAAPTLGETLANEPGISSSYFGPASSRPIIRGLSGSRVSMLSNSSSTLDVSDVSPDHATTVESLLAEQIEIIRGPATLLFGSSAAGGVVNVTDGRIPQQPAEKSISGALEVRGDTAADEQTFVGRLDGGAENFAWHVSAVDRETENIDIPGFATADPAERSDDEESGTLVNSYSETDGFNLGVSWVGSRGYLGASVSELNSLYGLPGPEEEEEGEEEPILYEGPFLDLNQTRFDVRGELQFDDKTLESLKFVLGANDYEHKEIEPSGEVATTFVNDQWQARLEAQHASIVGLNGTFGFQVDHRELEAVGEEAFIMPTETDALGLFIFEERDADWGTLQFGARIESLEHENSEYVDYDDEAFSVSAGVILPVAFNNELTLNLSRTERNPNAEELYSNGAHIATRQFEIGLLANDGQAGKETSLNYEVGVKRETGDIVWEASAFYYDIDDFVYQELTGVEIEGLPEAIYQQNDAEFYGTEVSVSMPVWESDGLKSRLRFFGDTVEAELSNGNDLPRIPPWRLGTDFTFGAEAWEAGLDVIYHAEQANISSFNTDAYTMVNASFLYRFELDSSEWEVFARGKNLLDEEARKSTSFIAAFAPLPGVSIAAGFRGRF
jgi:iron complex outermembrane receptor protein